MEYRNRDHELLLGERDETIASLRALLERAEEAMGRVGRSSRERCSGRSTMTVRTNVGTMERVDAVLADIRRALGRE